MAPDRDERVPRRSTAPGAASGRSGARAQESALVRPRDPLPTRVRDLPPLPSAYHDAVDEGLHALGLVLDDAARVAIDTHVRLLLAWTTAINLTAIRDPAEVARLHVLDSLAAVPHLRRFGVRGILDLGSGGGYPGLPVAIGIDAVRALLVDSVGKKVRFLQTVVEATRLGGRVAAEAARAEELAHDARDRGMWPVVTARAVSPLADLVEVALPLLEPGGRLVAWKRLPLDDEIQAAAPALAALAAGPIEVVGAGIPGLETHRLVIVPRAGPIEGRFPRDPALRRRVPIRQAPSTR